MLFDGDQDKESENVSHQPPPPSGPPPRVRVLSEDPRRATEIKVRIQSPRTGSSCAGVALLDSGATGMFMDPSYAEQNKIEVRTLPNPIPVYNVDGSLNEMGSIREEADVILRIGDHSERVVFSIIKLGKTKMIIGHTWLHHHNPEVDWKTGNVTLTRCPTDCRVHIRKIRSVERKKLYRHRARSREDAAVPSPPPVTPPVDDEDPILQKGDMIFGLYFPDDANHEEIVRATSTPSQRLAEAAKEDGPPKTFEELVPEEFRDFEDVFSKDAFDKLPDRKPWDHHIDFIPGSTLPRPAKLFPLSPAEQKELDAFLTENLASGRIRPSKSPVAAPVFFVKKKDGGFRLVQDYRKLNDITIKNAYPLPLISDVIDRLRDSKWFGKLDLRWGFHNLRMAEGDEWKAAFRTNRGSFEPLVMYFGLCNSPGSFQNMVNDVLREWIDKGGCMIYLDDILNFAKERDEYVAGVRGILQTLREHKLFLKPEKCEFFRKKIEYLGLVISHNHVEMDPVKVAGVVTWPAPRNLKEVQSFLGFVNFYRRFIKDFAKVSRPLNDLTRKDTPFRWTNSENTAFETLKSLVTSAPILVFPSESGRFRVEADASDFATGAVLSQIQEDEKWHPVAFLSKSLSEAERNYDIYDKELLAIVRALEAWRHYLEGSPHTIEILTDHQNLQYFRAAQKLNRRQARWSVFLSRFDYLLKHRSGSQSGKPDALSRRADHPRGTEDNSDSILLKPKVFDVKAAETSTTTALDSEVVIVEGPSRTFLTRIKSATEMDDRIVKIVKELNNGGTGLHLSDWTMEKGRVLYRGRVYVPLDAKLRHDIVRAHHDGPTVGHPGRWKTSELVSRHYWWPGMGRYIAKYVQSCDTCNRTKTFPSKPTGLLNPNRIPDRRWQIISVDLIGELPESQGFNCIMVVVDRLSKRIHAMPTTTTVDSAGIARLFRDHVWRNHGLPETIISDRGTTFTSKFMTELNTLLRISTNVSTAYHPQTDGQTERVNQEIEQFLRIFINHRQDDWAEWLPIAEFAYNNRIHSATRETPFRLDSGQDPRLGTEPTRTGRIEAVDDFLTRMKKTEDEAKSALQQAADDMARFHDRHALEAPSYKVGDKVWLDAHNITTDRPTKKLSDKWLGPYLVDKVLSRSAVRLKLPRSMRIHPVFNVSKLRLFQPDPIVERAARPPPAPVVQGGEVEYEVERIQNSRMFRGKLQYLVKWEGYPDSENEWLPEVNLKNSPDIVQEFHDAHPEAPRRIHSAEFAQIPFRNLRLLTDTPSDIPDWSIHVA